METSSFSSQMNIWVPKILQGQFLALGIELLCYAKSLQSCPTLCDPIDGIPSGSIVPGILQARTLEWVAISFSNAWKWKVKAKSLSRVQLLVTSWTAALPGSSIHGIFQARVLEWGAIAFSVYGNKNMQIRKWKIDACNEIVRRPLTAPRGLMAPLLSNLHDAATSQCCFSHGLILSLIT